MARILFIPLEPVSRTNERTPSLIRVLSRKHTLIGLERVPMFGTERSSLMYARFVRYAMKVLRFGIKHAADFDVVFSVHEWYGGLGLILSRWTNKPHIWDNHSGKLLLTRDTWRVPLQKVVCRFADAILTPTEADRESLVEDGYPPNKVFFVPTAADLSLAAGTPTAMRDLRVRLGIDTGAKIVLFMGNRSYQPNREAAEWINRELAPALSHRVENVRIVMAGGGSTPKRVSDHVMFVGFVPDIHLLVQTSQVGVVPMWMMGSGISTKMIDFMSCRRPAVASANIARGMPELRDGYNCLLAQDETELIEKTAHLLTHADVAERVGLEARRTVERHYSWDVWEARLDEVVRNVLD